MFSGRVKRRQVALHLGDDALGGRGNCRPTARSGSATVLETSDVACKRICERAVDRTRQLGIALDDAGDMARASATGCIRPPFRTGRNTGPSLVSAAASHGWTAASTGRSRQPRGIVTSCPCPFWSILLCRISAPVAVGASTRSVSIRGHRPRTGERLPRSREREVHSLASPPACPGSASRGRCSGEYPAVSAGAAPQHGQRGQHGG